MLCSVHVSNFPSEHDALIAVANRNGDDKGDEQEIMMGKGAERRDCNNAGEIR